MCSRVRPWGIAAGVALLISMLLPLASGVGRDTHHASLIIIAPPSGLALPVGQHIGVYYRFTGEAPAILELAADGTVLAEDRAEPGRIVTHAWTPHTAGLHQLRVCALAPDGTVLSSASVAVFGLPEGALVRIP